MLNTKTIIFLFIILLQTSIHVFAQPDAGSIIRDQSPDKITLPDRLPDPVRKSVPPSETSGGSGVLVKGFRFSGNEGLVTKSELTGLVETFINKKLDMAGLRWITSAITTYLRTEKGYLLARAYLPEQDVTDGIITIAVVSGKTDKKTDIRLKGETRISPSILQNIADRAVPSGGPALLEDIERSILLMKDLPGIEANASIEPGSEPGTSHIFIDVSEGALLKGSLSADNYGDRYTGKYRAAGRAAIMDPFGAGYRFDLAFTKADNLDLWHAGYSMPLGSSGLLLDTSYTGLSYKLGKDFSDLRIKGEADSLSLNMSYPLIRSRRTTVRAGAGIETLFLEDEADSIKVSDRKIFDISAYVTGNFSDTFLGAGISSFSFSIIRGDTNLSGLSSYRAADASGAGTAGSSIRAKYSIARLQRVTGAVSLYGSLRGQFASDNLDSSRRFILGGPNGVRAYPIGEAAGDEGHLLTLEARYDIPFAPAWANARLTGFFDAGHIRLHKDPWAGSVTNISSSNSYTLSSAGIGISALIKKRYEVNISYAHKIGRNDGAGIDGKNADNLDDSSSFWLKLCIRL